MSPKEPETANFALTRSKKEYRETKATVVIVAAENKRPPFANPLPRNNTPVPTNDFRSISTAWVTVASP
jgi:hypothetical protein